jgi:hypothetical protein
MPSALIDGIATRYEVVGSGPPLLMYAPGGIVPGHDGAHATSAARYLEECLPQSTYWDAAVEAQTEAATNPRLLEFLRGVQL